jgi:hypothetical protein
MVSIAPIIVLVIYFLLQYFWIVYSSKGYAKTLAIIWEVLGLGYIHNW